MAEHLPLHLAWEISGILGIEDCCRVQPSISWDVLISFSSIFRTSIILGQLRSCINSKTRSDHDMQQLAARINNSAGGLCRLAESGISCSGSCRLAGRKISGSRAGGIVRDLLFWGKNEIRALPQALWLSKRLVRAMKQLIIPSKFPILIGTWRMPILFSFIERGSLVTADRMVFNRGSFLSTVSK